jgi:hypothetical protein
MSPVQVRLMPTLHMPLSSHAEPGGAVLLPPLATGVPCCEAAVPPAIESLGPLLSCDFNGDATPVGTIVCALDVLLMTPPMVLVLSLSEARWSGCTVCCASSGGGAGAAELALELSSAAGPGGGSAGGPPATLPPSVAAAPALATEDAFVPASLAVFVWRSTKCPPAAVSVDGWPCDKSTSLP